MTGNRINPSQHRGFPASTPRNRPQGNNSGPRILPLTTGDTRRHKRNRASWVCVRDYGAAGAFFGLLAVLASLAFFLAEWFKPDQRDPLAEAVYAEQRFQSDIAAREYCLKLRVSLIISLSHVHC